MIAELPALQPVVSDAAAHAAENRAVVATAREQRLTVGQTADVRPDHADRAGGERIEPLQPHQLAVDGGPIGRVALENFRSLLLPWANDHARRNLPLVGRMPTVSVSVDPELVRVDEAAHHVPRADRFFAVLGDALADMHNNCIEQARIASFEETGADAELTDKKSSSLPW